MMISMALELQQTAVRIHFLGSVPFRSVNTSREKIATLKDKVIPGYLPIVIMYRTKLNAQ